MIKESLGVCILSGGKSSRMGGDNKAFLPLGETTFIETLIHQFSSRYPVYLSVRNSKLFEELQVSCIVDATLEIGPLGGIYTGLSQVKEDYLFVLPCDSPFVTQQHLQTLCYAMEEETLGCCFVGEKLYPTIGIYGKKMLPLIEMQIKNGIYALKELYRNPQMKTLNLDTCGISKDTVLNINTKEEYEKIQRCF